MDDVDRKVIEIIADEMNEHTESIRRESNLANDISMDSIDFIDITLTLEDEYGIVIPDEDAEKFVTVGDVADFVKRMIANRRAA